MLRKVLLLNILFVFSSTLVFSQGKVVSRKDFFNSEEVIEMTLTTDLKKLVTQKKNPTNQPAKIEWINGDSAGNLTEDILIRPRGNFRKENCQHASLMIDFRSGENSRLKNLKKMKLVAPCGRSADNEQLLLKEYLVYKIYNLFTDMSFRVRLIRVKFVEVSGKGKPFEQYAFLIEDVDDMAARSKSVEKQGTMVLSERADRMHTLFVSIFQYMIGNTDWSIPNFHNIKLIVPKTDTMVAPFVIPYDFDYSGAVNAAYAIPHEMLGIEKVTDRLYRGFPRDIEEIKVVAANFLEKEAAVKSLVSDFEKLTPYHKKQMLDFFAPFFKILTSERDLKRVFIDEARKQ